MTDQPNFAQNPDELFDVVTANGQPTGITKRRADVHRDGDWHRAIHVWVYGVDGSGPYILMNQRGRHKDTWPLALDATVGGHLGAGETVEDAYREVEEEIGITVNRQDLQYVWTRARESHGALPGIIDREIQEIFLYRDDRPLADYNPNPAELEGLVKLLLQDAIELFAGRISRTTGQILRPSGHVFEPIEITNEQLLMLPGDDYFHKVAIAIQRTVSPHSNDIDRMT